MDKATNEIEAEDLKYGEEFDALLGHPMAKIEALTPSGDDG